MFDLNPNKDYNFISNEIKNEIITRINEAKNIINNDLLPIINKLNERLEGNIFMSSHSNYNNDFFDKQVNVVIAARRKSINNVLEIGFNAGFSALLMLLTNKNIKMTCVDI